MKKIKINKEQSVTIIFILFCLLGYKYFPAVGNFQYKAVMFIFLGLLPFLYNKYFLKRESVLNNITIGDWKKNLKYLSIGLTIAFLAMAILFQYTDIGLHYLLPKNVKTDFTAFLIYEFGGIAFMIFLYELFFRGFIQNYFSKFSEKWSMLVQFSFFLVMIAMFWNVPYWFYVVYLIFTPIAGWIFYKSKSLIFSFAGQWLLMVIIDATFIALTIKR